MTALWKRITANWTLFVRTMRLLWSFGPLILVSFMATSVFSAIIPALTIWLNTKIIDIIAYGTFTEGRTQELILTVVAYVVILLIDRALIPASQILQAILTDRSTAQVNVILMEKANSFLGIRPFEDQSLRDRLQYVQSQAAWRPMNLIGFYNNAIRYGIIIVSMLALLSTLNPIIVAVVLFTGIPQLIAEFRFSKVTIQLSMAQSPDWRKLSYYQEVVMGGDHAKELRVWGIGAYFIRLYKTTFNKISDDLSSLRLARLRTFIGFSIIGGIGLGLAFADIAWLALRHKVMIGQLTLYVQAIIQIQGNFMELAFGSTLFIECLGWMKELFGVLDMKEESVVSPSVVDTSEMLVDVPSNGYPACRIEFNNVSFKYPHADTKVLENVSFTIEPGEFVALVGQNGAGKTTIVKLLTRMYDAVGGQILVDDLDVQQYHPKLLRQRIAAVFQDFSKFQLTLRENISFGDMASFEDDNKIVMAALRALVTEFSNELPDGLNTTLGNQFQGGIELSGGQWQRVALARAFMRNAPILLLDEPTSALDVHAEAEFHRQIRELSRGKTTLVISHRFSTVRIADKIIVLDSGRVVEMGSHSELMQKDGYYASMYQEQASQYVSV